MSQLSLEKFYDSVDHEWLLRKLKLAGEHFLRLICRMLRGSILHADGSLAETERGTRLGSPVSPMLGNIRLHYLLDDWLDAEDAGRGEFIRYADDTVFVFAHEATAQSFQAALQYRLGEAGLSLSTAKSDIVFFAVKAPKGVVSFLGFDFFWGLKGGGRGC